MAQFTIAPLTLFAGSTVFGPLTTADGWTHFNFTLETALLVSCDVLAEFSSDGTSWNPLVQATGITMGVDAVTSLPRTSMQLSANWVPPMPAGQVRTTLNNSVAFASNGGATTVT